MQRKDLNEFQMNILFKNFPHSRLKNIYKRSFFGFNYLRQLHYHCSNIFSNILSEIPWSR